MSRVEELISLLPEEIRDAMKSLGDDTRLAIMIHLMIETDKNGIGSSFREIKDELNVSQGSLSNHLKNLLESGLIKNEYKKVEGRKEFSFYLPTNFGRNFMMKLLEFAEEATSKEEVLCMSQMPKIKPGRSFIFSEDAFPEVGTLILPEEVRQKLEIREKEVFV